MELRALIEAFQMLPADQEATLYSDSQLCVKTVNEWAASWAARGWRRKTGPIANLEMVQELYTLARSRPKAKLTWIRAHDGSRWNEYADALATTYLRESR
jgi:ribonuclease HI